MKPTQIPFLKFDETDELVAEGVEEVVSSGIYFNGRFTKQFKNDFSHYVGRRHMIPTANCTDALEIVLRSLNLGPDDDVIVPAFGWYSDASMVKWVGANILFVDIDLSSFSISLNALKAIPTEKVKALILPHLYGLITPEIQEIVSFCQEHHIFLIEDCAQAHGATFLEQQAGSFGNVSVFSFYPTKNLGGIGDAGCILTDRESEARAYALLANHGQTERNHHETLGRNSRIDEIQAAILTKRLPTLNYQNKKRKELAEVYVQQLQHLPIRLPHLHVGHVFHQFVLLSDKRDALQAYLKERGIETAIHYPQPLYEMTPFKMSAGLSFPNALQASKAGLSLPIYPNHSVEEILFVCEQIVLFFKGQSVS